MKLKLSKCKFGSRDAEKLEHIADENGIRPSEAHMKVR